MTTVPQAKVLLPGVGAPPLPHATAGLGGPGGHTGGVIARGLYGMIDPAFVVPGSSASALHAEAVRQGAVLLEEGVRTIQLRVKHLTTGQRLAIFADLAALADRRGLQPDAVTWIVNDDVAAARRACAPRARVLAHLGQEDGPDPDVPFGRSTHTLAQVRDRGNAAYIGFGPVFGTATKDTGYDARGVDLLRAAVAASSVPVVAIGGITLATLASVQATGVHAWAVIGAIWRAADPRAEVRRFVAASERPGR